MAQQLHLKYRLLRTQFEISSISWRFIMHSTRIDIPEKNRNQLAELLNVRLAEILDLKLQTKQAHWNVKGPSFIALHELFDDIAENLEEHSDTVAERITALGGIAEGTAPAIAKRSKLTPYSLTISSGRDHVEALANALAAVGKNYRRSIDEADELKDKDTADLFTGVSRDLDKHLWFVEAHVQADK